MRFLLLLSGVLGLGYAFAEPMPNPAGSVPAAGNGSPTPANMTTSSAGLLSPVEQQMVLDCLRSTYVDQDALRAAEVAHRPLPELLNQLRPPVYLASAREDAAAVRPFVSQVLFDRFGYIRFGTLRPEVVSLLDATLQDFRTRGVSGCVLDFRTTGWSGDFDTAIAIVSRFVPGGQLAFNADGPNGQARRTFSTSNAAPFPETCAIVVDAATAGVAEVIAGAIRAHTHALLIGEKTAGDQVLRQRCPIGDQWILAVPAARAILPGATVPIGLIPDLLVTVPGDQERKILGLAEAEPLDTLLVDQERAHTNEAALMAGRNPELDAFETEQAGQKTPPKPKDLILQRALDFLVTVNFYRQ